MESERIKAFVRRGCTSDQSITTPQAEAVCNGTKAQTLQKHTSKIKRFHLSSVRNRPLQAPVIEGWEGFARFRIRCPEAGSSSSYKHTASWQASVIVRCVVADGLPEGKKRCSARDNFNRSIGFLLIALYWGLQRASGGWVQWFCKATPPPRPLHRRTKPLVLVFVLLCIPSSTIPRGCIDKSLKGIEG